MGTTTPIGWLMQSRGTKFYRNGQLTDERSTGQTPSPPASASPAETAASSGTPPQLLVPLSEGDALETGDDGTATLALSSGWTIRLAERSVLRVQTEPKSTSLKLVKGELHCRPWSSEDALPADLKPTTSELRVYTQFGNVGVPTDRRAIFTMNVFQSKARLAIVDGIVELHDHRGRRQVVAPYDESFRSEPTFGGDFVLPSGPVSRLLENSPANGVATYVVLGVAIALVVGMLRLLPQGVEPVFDLIWPAIQLVTIEPLRFVQQAVVVFFALAVFWRVQRRNAAQRPAVTAYDEVAIDAAVRQIFTSEKFRTAVRDLIPVRSADGETLDHVPFILKAINDRLVSARQEMSRYLAFTLLAGLGFSGVVIYYGYVLVNETAAGFPSEVVRLRESTELLRRQLDDIAQPLSANTSMREVIELSRRARISASDSDVYPLLREAVPLLDEIGQRGATNATLLALDDFLQARGHELTQNEDGGSPSPADAGFQKALKWVDLRPLATSVHGEALNVRRLQFSATVQLRQVGEVADKAEKYMLTGEFRAADIVKRVAVGFVVVTFLLAILRYLASLFRDARVLVGTLVDQEVYVRRFCIALSSSQDAQTRQALVKEFLEGAKASGTPADDTLKDVFEKDRELMKEVVQTFLKKL